MDDLYCLFPMPDPIFAFLKQLCDWKMSFDPQFFPALLDHQPSLLAIVTMPFKGNFVVFSSLSLHIWQKMWGLLRLFFLLYDFSSGYFWVLASTVSLTPTYIAAAVLVVVVIVYPMFSDSGSGV